MTETRRNFAIAIFLLLATFAVYSQVRNYDFVNYDDPDYVHLREGFAWAFTSGYAANWFPITWLSHILDNRILRIGSGVQHLENVLIHSLSTLLLFLFLLRATGARWRSAFVAFVFALHPLHVESVAWISERKDVLCAFFWFLTLLAYAYYVERPGLRRYLMVLLTFSLGLMSKSMMVTLPVVLLLLDVWPLRRPRRGVVLEKLPLFALAASISIVTFVVQQRGGSVIAIDSIPIATRFAKALVSYVTYIVQFFWPAGLAVFYPYPTELSPHAAIFAGFVVIGVSIAVLRVRPLATGWFWYLVTLAPVIGLIQVGRQAHADRYTYIPLVGLAIMLAWGAGALVDRWPQARYPIAGVAIAGCTAFLVVTWFQIQYWRNSQALFEHAIQVTNGNYVAYNGLGLAQRDQGRISEAILNYQEAVKIRPEFIDAQNNLGEAQLAQGNVAEALPHIEEALRLRPDYAEAHINLGTALNKLGKLAEAREQYLAALQQQPDNAVAHCGLGVVLSEQHDNAGALQQFAEAIQLKADYADAHYNLGWLLAGLGRTAEAIAEFQETIRLQPNNVEAHYNLGTALGSQGKLEEAIAELSTAVRLKPEYAKAQFNLGTALASTGRIDEAVSHFSEAVRIDPNFTAARESLEYAKSLRK